MKTYGFCSSLKIKSHIALNHYDGINSRLSSRIISVLKNLMNLRTDIFDLTIFESDIICSIECHKNLILKSPRPKSANLKKYYFKNSKCQKIENLKR